MIEVEKKFRLDKRQEEQLTKDAEFLGSKMNEDVYWDTEDYQLTCQDHWLRLRNSRWELKRRMHELGHKLGGTAYDEIENEEGIRAFLHLPGNGPMEPDLLAAGYKPFATIRNERRSYKHGAFHIDLDVCDFNYGVAEIELMVDRGDDRQVAIERIEKFAEGLGLDQTHVRGKVIEFLHRFRRPHYERLKKAGVL
ncbi:CYTH domain-containing protein [Candidatus Uhrbacteria bacterium]|nr:CYTH domain-containing protein [Candidatus Uhrbacteria bacterium]